MTLLTRGTLAGLPPTIEAPRGRGPLGTGVVHFGPGAFHRAHQAAFLDTLVDADPRWGIAAVALRSRETVDALAAQDGLYTLAIRDAEPRLRVLGVHTRWLGPGDARAAGALLVDPAVRLVTTTVTEKGYCLLPDGTLDLAHPDIRHDLTDTAAPASVIGWIVRGLAARRAAGVAPYVVMPCDNLANNGRKLAAALVAFAGETDAGLADWIAGEVRVPSTMVDAITPATDAALIGDVAAALGVEDRAPVQREAFAQWVVEAHDAPGPDLAAVGVTVTGDVGGWERVKLRILNGAHSALAYAGLLAGHSSVAEAIADPTLARLVNAMITDEVIPTLPPLAGLDLPVYAAAVLRRFTNPVLVHRLEQIAQDGSQKLPYRWGDTLLACRRAGRMPAGIVTAYGAWIAFLMRRARSGTPVVDPAAAALVSAAAGGDPAATATRLLAQGLGLPVALADDTALRDALGDAARRALADG